MTAEGQTWYSVVFGSRMAPMGCLDECRLASRAQNDVNNTNPRSSFLNTTAIHATTSIRPAGGLQVGEHKVENRLLCH